MAAPAGWYPDPQQPVPGTPPQQRYWDGAAWTVHVAPLTPDPAYGQPAYGQPVYGQPASASQPGYGMPATTPDGVRLAGWWHRVGAYLIDLVILAVIIALVALPFLRDVLSAFGDYFHAAVTASQNGAPAPSSAQFQRDIAGAVLAISGISFLVNAIYTMAFLSWKQATPGKLAVGLRVRLRERPGLPASAVLLRWGTQFGAPGLVALVPLVGLLSSLFSLFDVLWPLWDGNKQALHDKVAKTNVVRSR
jgi:uncharacterized RDD family membrane protein YckC